MPCSGQEEYCRHTEACLLPHYVQWEREKKEDIQRPACCHDTLAGCRCLGADLLTWHATRTKEVTLGLASYPHGQPAMGATRMYKYVGGQMGKRENQNSLKILKRNEAGDMGWRGIA